MAQEAMTGVTGITPEETQRRLQEDANALLIDVRDAVDIPATGIIPGGVNVSLGMLPVRADQELPEEYCAARAPDRSRQIITTCVLGPNAAIGAKLLKQMGFTNVAFMDGGRPAGKDANLPTE